MNHFVTCNNNKFAIFIKSNKFNSVTEIKKMSLTCKTYVVKIF